MERCVFLRINIRGDTPARIKFNHNSICIFAYYRVTYTSWCTTVISRCDSAAPLQILVLSTFDISYTTGNEVPDSGNMPDMQPPAVYLVVVTAIPGIDRNVFSRTLYRDLAASFSFPYRARRNRFKPREQAHSAVLCLYIESCQQSRQLDSAALSVHLGEMELYVIAP